MAEFLGDLAFVAATALAIWGLLLVRRSRMEESGALVMAAGVLALAVGVGTALCAGSYMVKYWVQGDFDRAWPMQTRDRSMDTMGMGMGMGMGGMMGERRTMQQRRMGQRPAAEAPPDTEAAPAETDQDEPR